MLALMAHVLVVPIMENHRSVDKGQAIYNKFVLSIYDSWVLGFSNSYLWRCPTKFLREFYAKYSSLNHMDVGVGTGYYPDRCLSGGNRRLALLDLNPNSLEVAAGRVIRFRPEIYHANVLQRLDIRCDKFDSISLFYLLHCLPGPFDYKTQVFKYLRPYLNSDGVLFGSTILGQDVNAGFFGKRIMSIYQKKGIFDNSQDNLEALLSTLRNYFLDVDIRVVGCVAIFVCTGLKSIE